MARNLLTGKQAPKKQTKTATKAKPKESPSKRLVAQWRNLPKKEEQEEESHGNARVRKRLDRRDPDDQVDRFRVRKLPHIFDALWKTVRNKKNQSPTEVVKAEMRGKKQYNGRLSSKLMVDFYFIFWMVGQCVVGVTRLRR